MNKWRGLIFYKCFSFKKGSLIYKIRVQCLPIASFETLVFLDFFLKKEIDEKIISVNLKMENVIF